MRDVILECKHFKAGVEIVSQGHRKVGRYLHHMEDADGRSQRKEPRVRLHQHPLYFINLSSPFPLNPKNQHPHRILEYQILTVLAASSKPCPVVA